MDAAREVDPRELLPEVDPPANPALAHAVKTDEMKDGGRCYLSTKPCLSNLS